MVAVVPIRKAPQEQSEMTSQLLFGEYYRVDGNLDKWLKITTSFDHFTGWIDRKFYREVAVARRNYRPYAECPLFENQ